VEGRGEVLTQGENAWLLVLINKRAREVMMMPKAMRGNRLLICYLFKVREREREREREWEGEREREREYDGQR